MRRQRLELYELPDYVPRKNKDNDYGFDPHEQEHDTYTGMGADINVHDQWACESMGAIQDRTREHLGQSDKAIIAYRRLLRQAIAKAGKGDTPLMVLDRGGGREITGPAASTASARPTTGRAIGNAPRRRRRQGSALGPTGTGLQTEARSSMPSPQAMRHGKTSSSAAVSSIATVCGRPQQERAAARASSGDQEAQARTGPLLVRRSARRAARQDAGGVRSRRS